MANLAGLGAFASGLAGGINQGMANYAGMLTKGREQAIEQERLGMEKQKFGFEKDKFAWEKQSKEDTADLNTFTKDQTFVKALTPEQQTNYWKRRAQALKDKKPELAALYDLTSQAGEEHKKQLETTVKNIETSAKNKDVESGQIALDQLGALVGYDSPSYLRYKYGYAGKLYSDLNRIKELKTGLKSGEIDPKSVTEEQKNLLMSEPALEEKFVANASKDLLDIYRKQLESGKQKWEEWGYGQKALVGERGDILRKEKVPVKPEKAGGSANEGMAKVGNLAAVNRELASKYLPLAKANIPAGSESGTKVNNLILSLQSTDQFSGSINDARLRDTLTPEQKGGYDWVKVRAQELASKHPPAKAVNEALKEWQNFNKGATTMGKKGKKVLDTVTATQILKEAGGDKNKARQIAKERGYNF